MQQVRKVSDIEKDGLSLDEKKALFIREMIAKYPEEAKKYNLKCHIKNLIIE
jgi:hypothetical protein